MWVPFYMRLGIPVWRQSARLLTKEQFWQAAAQLDGTDLPGKWYPTITFKRISQDEVAFRHKLWEVKVGIRFRAPVRGMVRLADDAYTVTVTNYLPWASPAAVLIFLWLFSSFNRPEFGNNYGWLFGAFLLIIVAITMGVQLIIFRQIDDRILAEIVGENYLE
jgi:hypothetical protein